MAPVKRWVGIGVGEGDADVHCDYSEWEDDVDPETTPLEAHRAVEEFKGDKDLWKAVTVVESDVLRFFELIVTIWNKCSRMFYRPERDEN